MKFIIEKEVFERLPGLNIGVIVVKGMNNHGKDPEILDLLGEVEVFISSNFTQENIEQHQNIASWRKAFKEFGKEPVHYHTSVEKLIKQILKQASIEHQNKLADICNYISLKYMIPIAFEDLDKIFGDIALGFAKGTESFIGEEPGNVIRPAKNEIVYKDSLQVLSRGWNSKRNYFTKADKDTINAIIYVEGLPPIQYEEVQTIINELIELIDTYCQGDIGYHILNGDVTQLDIGKLETGVKLRY